ncbi:MAG: hypothetical protein EBT13_05880 [Rhodobacteraceae bacterium]|nr:hypothetical protein [Paracoccaceae bacterium]
MTQIAPLIVPPRDPSQVMRLSRMGSFHAHRLSFMRILLRRAKAEGWQFDKRLFDIDDRGVGRAVYTMQTGSRAYSLVAFAHDLPDHMRSDRVIATAWDATFTLFDGIPTAPDLDRLAANIPLQEAGRVKETELSVSRANRSVRLWAHCVDRLAQGLQPDPALVEDVGYLMRTTAVYGSGKLGAADREATADRPEFTPPFQIEMLSVWLTRAFVADLCEHMAKVRNPRAVPFSPKVRRRLGIGNSTGLGMAPYLINHPILLNNWIAAKEEALARVRSIAAPNDQDWALFCDLLRRSITLVAGWKSDHPIQIAKVAQLQTDLDRLQEKTNQSGAQAQGWDAFYLWAERNLGEDAQELLVSLMLEPHGALVDGLADCMAADESHGARLNGAMTVGALRAHIVRIYDWALAINWADPKSDARVWYVSEEKLEPRLGERHAEPVAAYEQPLQPGRDAARLWAATEGWDPDTTVAAFAVAHPEYRHILRRVQTAARFPYAEIHDNTIDGDMLPIDLLRAKLSFFGAQLFDPRSDRWVRITMFRGAPYPSEIADADAEFWGYPA